MYPSWLPFMSAVAVIRRPPPCVAGISSTVSCHGLVGASSSLPPSPPAQPRAARPKGITGGDTPSGVLAVSVPYP